MFKMYNKSKKLQRELPFHYLVYYLPWQYKMIKPSLNDQVFMQDYYNKQF